jgi:hypothetical protein
MKYVLSGIILLHGAIHLLGFVKGFGLAEVRELQSYIPRSSALIWLSVFVLMSLAAAGLFFNYRGWIWPAGAGVLTSAVLILIHWSDARYGMIPNIIIVGAVLISISGMLFDNKIDSEKKSILAEPGQQPETIITDEDLAPLPVAVRRWLASSGTSGKKRTESVWLRQNFRLKLKPEQEKWHDAVAEQYFTTANPAFIWTIDLRMSPFISIKGRDKFVDGRGEMQMRMNSVINLGTETGEKIDEGTLQRYLGEIVWFPSAALSPHITWEEIDSLTARATMRWKNSTGSGVFSFNENGDFVKFSALRYYGNDPGSRRFNWIIEAEQYSVFDGIRIPSRCSATWKFDEGDWTWCNVEITDLVYKRVTNEGELIQQPDRGEDALALCDEISDGYVDLHYKENLYGFKWDTVCREIARSAQSISTDKEFYLAMNKYLARLQDGHLLLRYKGAQIRNNILSYPDEIIDLLGLRLIEGRVIIVSAPSGYNLTGHELLSINGVPLSTIINSLSQIYIFRGDQEANKSQILVYNKYWDYFDLYQGSFPDDIFLTVQENGSSETVKIERDSYSNRRESITGIRWGLPGENQKPGYSFPEKEIALLTVPSFEADPDSFKSLINELADTCEKQKIRGLIIDLRYNAGGNESFRDLLGYLTGDTLDLLYYRYRLSDSFTRDFPERLKKERRERKVVAESDDKNYSEWFAWQIYPSGKEYLRKTALVVLANENIFSSATNFVYGIKNNRLGTLIANKMPLSGHGFGKPVLLPGKRFTLNNCYFQAAGTNYEPLENNQLTPDHHTEMTLQAVKENRDIFIEEAIRLIRENRIIKR